jgi:hypothetical protein
VRKRYAGGVRLDRRVDKPFIDCRATGIPTSVVWDALLFAARMTPLCDQCPRGRCRCGTYHKNSLGIAERQIRNWEQKQVLLLYPRIKPQLQPQAAIGMGARWVMADDSRHPMHRHPESAGFAIDHEVGERWRRFNLLKTKRK